MRRALNEYIIEGVKTTIPFYRVVLGDPRFRKGKYSTDFIDQLLEVHKSKRKA
jgi:pyruvate carboxylase